MFDDLVVLVESKARRCPLTARAADASVQGVPYEETELTMQAVSLRSLLDAAGLHGQPVEEVPRT